MIVRSVACSPGASLGGRMVAVAGRREERGGRVSHGGTCFAVWNINGLAVRIGCGGKGSDVGEAEDVWG